MPHLLLRRLGDGVAYQKSSEYELPADDLKGGLTATLPILPCFNRSSRTRTSRPSPTEASGYAPRLPTLVAACQRAGQRILQPPEMPILHAILLLQHDVFRCKNRGARTATSSHGASRPNQARHRERAPLAGTTAACPVFFISSSFQVAILASRYNPRSTYAMQFTVAMRWVTLTLQRKPHEKWGFWDCALLAYPLARAIEPSSGPKGLGHERSREPGPRLPRLDNGVIFHCCNWLPVACHVSDQGV